MITDTSGMARVGFIIATAAAAAVTAYLYVNGSSEWVFFASVAASAFIELLSSSVQGLREGVSRIVIDSSCLSLIAASALWLWRSSGSTVMLVNAVIVLTILALYAAMIVMGRLSAAVPED